VERRSGLGRGLAALIPAQGRERQRGMLEDVAVTAIEPHPNQPRVHFDEESLAELAASIRAVGVLQPVLVRPGSDDGRYVLVAGERRWRAARRAGLDTIPAIVRDTDDVSAIEHALVENLHRQDLTALEEAAAYQQLIEDFALTHEEVASRVGRSRATVTNTLRLLQLPPSIQHLLADGRLTTGHARALLGTPDRLFQERLAQRAVAEHLSVRAVEEAVRAHREPASEAAPAPAPRTVPALRPPGVLELEELLSDYLDTRVGVTMGDTRGKMVIEFATLEDLERIYRVITGAADH
jgi:ParB family chromosome partitioning protein